VPVDSKVDVKTTPPDQVARMDAGTFFNRLAMAMKDNPPYPEDADYKLVPLMAALEKLKKLGIEPGKDFDISKIDPAVARGLEKADKDTWELYKLDDDWSQASDLAAKMPMELADKKELFLIEFTKNSGLPIGGGLWVLVFHPELRAAPPYTAWTFPGAITRMPEFAAPALGNRPNVVTVDADIPANASGVLYALGGFSGGLTLYVKDGTLSYEYNLFEITRTHIKAKDKLPTGKVKIAVETSYVEPRAAGPLKVVLQVNGKEVVSGVVPVSAPLGFTANDCLDFGIDLGSPVGLEYYDQAPFRFNGTIEQARVEYTR
jgi:hypothetical protein